MKNNFRTTGHFLLVTILILFFLFLTTSAVIAQNFSADMQRDSTEYDITRKIEGIVFKKGITKLQDFKDGSYLAIKNKNGKYEYLVIKGPATYSPISNKSFQTSNEPIVISVGFCSVTVYKSAATGAKVTTGNSKITATVKCS